MRPEGSMQYVSETTYSGMISTVSEAGKASKAARGLPCSFFFWRVRVGKSVTRHPCLGFF